MKKLTVPQIRAIFKRSDLSLDFCNELSRLLDMYRYACKIDTSIRRVRFLAQLVHEVQVLSNGKVRKRENLNYSTDGLIRISKYFRSHKNLALKFGRNKHHKANIKAIANLMYADKNRAKHLKLGNVKENDGYIFRGVFGFQSTGRYNVIKDIAHIKKLFDITLLDDNGKLYPQAVDNNTIFILGAMAHWHRTKMYKLGSTNEVTDKINKGLPKRMKKKRLATAMRIKQLLMA